MKLDLELRQIEELEGVLTAIRDHLAAIRANQEHIMSTVADLQTAVAAQTTVITAVEAKVAAGGLSAADQATLDAAVADLTANTAKLETLVAPAPAPAPAPAAPAA